MSRAMLPPDPADRSNGWEAIAAGFIEHSRRSTIGVARIRAWVATLPPNAGVLNLGCGPGGPRSDALAVPGFMHRAIDAAPSLAQAYQHRHPAALVACEAAEDSACFGEAFDGVLAWGLLFLLPEDAQGAVVRRVAAVLKPGGRFLFTAPGPACAWRDLGTGRPSLSLGADAYRAILAAAGLLLVAEYEDEGDNHYYDAVMT